ncbi:hypothetical protein [Mammaliicoccus sciuri]|uniref:hypothetical protein n=1 Tax=Mammaliicoccus sciuri TaxID=1296 RepID=UPI0034DDC9FA
MNRLEQIVNKLNDNIKNFNFGVIHDCIYDLHNEGYISQLDAQYLLEDIMNDRCPIPLSSFKEDVQ